MLIAEFQEENNGHSEGSWWDIRPYKKNVVFPLTL
jgi:hypothetical protein